jgi:LuxR family maltose regulon positive regulatory protein
MVVVDEAAFRRLPGSIAVHRAGQARILGDAAGTVAHARRALDLVGEHDHLSRGGAAGLLALASWSGGDLEEASRWYAAGMASLEKAGHLSDVIGCALALADIRLAQGRLHDAMRTYEQGLQLATERDGHVLRGAADMHTGMSELFRERDDLHAASQHLQASHELGDENGLPQNPYRSRVAAARIRQAEGDLDDALELLDEAERLYVGDFSPDVRPVAAVKARVWVAQGRMDEALGWARERGVLAADDLHFLREFEHITLARVLLARSMQEGVELSLREAMGLLERLRHAAEDGGRTGSVIEILVLQSLAHQMHRELPSAVATLERALALAEPEGYVRVIVDEGPSMADLVREAAKRRIAPTYVRRLLAAFGDPGDSARVRQALVEPLSERELDVLRLLGTDLDGPDIARELVVSLHTVRSHTKSIYAKLGVNSRRAAVRRAAELGLLTRTRHDR